VSGSCPFTRFRLARPFGVIPYHRGILGRLNRRANRTVLGRLGIRRAENEEAVFVAIRKENRA
jgi:hypothetical protein